MDSTLIKTKLYELFRNEAGIVIYESSKDVEFTSELVDLLHIGRVIHTEYPDINAEIADKPSGQTVKLDRGEINEDDCVVQRILLPMGTVQIITLFPVKGYTWTPEERGFVSDFITIIITFKSRIKMKEYIDYALFHDRNFGFFNSFFLSRTLSMIARLERLTEYNVIFFNLTNLSGINQILGRKNADEIIKRFIVAASEHLRQPECICMMGGDNFTAIVRHENLDHVLNVLKGIDVDSGGKYTELIRMSAYCGVYRCTGSEPDISVCIDSAQLSMHIAKKNHVSVQLYDETMVDLVKNTKKIESGFSSVLIKEEFCAFYQPKVNLTNYKLIGAEALCRWVKGKKILTPDKFIPVLETSNRICTLDFYMLEHVCADIAGWIAAGKSPIRVSSNFSRKHLANRAFVQEVVNIVDSYKVPHSLIVIEVTETTSEADMKRLAEVVSEFKSSGFEVSVDDFGMGYSSMSMIKDILFSELKIDKSFLNNKDIGSRDMIMMKHIISMAEELGMSTIAEGVETVDQVSLLRKYGCFRGQGFFFDKPLSKEDFERVLDNPDYSLKGLPFPE